MKTYIDILHFLSERRDDIYIKSDVIDILSNAHNIINARVYMRSIQFLRIKSIHARGKWFEFNKWLWCRRMEKFLMSDWKVLSEFKNTLDIALYICGAKHDIR